MRYPEELREKAYRQQIQTAKRLRPELEIGLRLETHRVFEFLDMQLSAQYRREKRSQHVNQKRRKNVYYAFFTAITLLCPPKPSDKEIAASMVPVRPL